MFQVSKLVYRYIYREILKETLIGIVECLHIFRIFEQQVCSRTAQSHDAYLTGIVSDDGYSLTVVLRRIINLDRRNGLIAC